jgi:hypothetical protein
MENRTNEGMTLSKALSIKNRLAGRLSQARSNVETYNSALVGQRDEAGKTSVDVRAEYARFLVLQDAVVTVKAAIQRANAAIYEDVLRLGELKAHLQMLSGLNTKHGSEPAYTGVKFDYAATIKKPEALESIRKLEAEIDTLQDKINQYNATTRIELPTRVLELAR